MSSCEKQENYRTSVWTQSVRRLCRFIRQYLRLAETESSLLVRADLLLVEKILLDRITMFFNWRNCYRDSASPERFESSGARGVRSDAVNESRYLQLTFWDGKSATLQDHWKLVRVDNHAGRIYFSIDRLTLFRAANAGDVETLCETSLDEVLNMLFGLADRTEPASREITRHPSLSKPVRAFTLARQSRNLRTV